MFRRLVSIVGERFPAPRHPRGTLPRAVALLLLLALLPLAPLFTAGALAQTAAGFDDELVVAIPQPTAFAFLPDGRMLVTNKPGQLLLVENGQLAEQPVLDLSAKICANRERGLLGVAVDPEFATTGYVFLYYTAKRGNSCPTALDRATKRTPVNRVARFVMTGATIDPGSEKVLLGRIVSPQGNHNAGDLQFGPDDNLYVSVGDGGNGGTARDLGVLNGKILRIDREGGVPDGNPYKQTGVRCNEGSAANPRAACQEVFARGLRNPFRFAFDPDAAEPTFFINDVGAAVWEEVNRGKAGANYGWDRREGPCPINESDPCGGTPAGLTNPLHAYKHSTDCESITGGAFVPDDAGWPAALADAYLYADFVCGRFFQLEEGGNDPRVTGFGDATGRPVHLGFGPDGDGTGQALYYATFTNEGGQIRRLSPADQAP